jgi:trans-2,3-dihydro-3-hydroxyanthranilate isomerase
VFVFPPERPAHRARLRIFTPVRELPFAGHPTVGTAVLLAIEALGDAAPEADVMLSVEEKVGPVRCVVALRSDRAGRAIFDAPKLAQSYPGGPDPETAAAALGLLPAEIGFENHEISAFTAGVPYFFVPVRGLEVMARVKPQGHLWQKAFPDDVAAYLYTRETPTQGHDFRARMFWAGAGIVEDPATGSAAAAFAGAVARFDRPPSGTHRVVIEQGFEMGRPSLIAVEVDVEGPALHAVRIGGDAVVVGRGTLEVGA